MPRVEGKPLFTKGRSKFTLVKSGNTNLPIVYFSRSLRLSHQAQPTMSQLIQALSAILPAKQVITDSLRRLAYGTDARFYRLTPEVVAVVECEEEVQAVTDRVLALIGGRLWQLRHRLDCRNWSPLPLDCLPARRMQPGRGHAPVLRPPQSVIFLPYSPVQPVVASLFLFFYPRPFNPTRRNFHMPIRWLPSLPSTAFNL